MNFDDSYINSLLEDEIKFIDGISIKYAYPDNITHLLYIIILAFIMKYGVKNKKVIEDCFINIPIIINDKQDNVYQAYYFSQPIKKQDNITTNRGIVLQNYNNIGLMQLLDNLVHEINHAINSFNNEIKIVDKYIVIRTGVVYNYFDKNSLRFIRKGKDAIIEEIINTKQTELIIDIIKGLNNYSINNTTIVNTLYSISHSFDANYKSNSYLLETTICKELLNNKTFLSTLEILRLDGSIDDIHNFFDSIAGFNGALLELSGYLNDLKKLQIEYTKTKLFKKSKINKIKEVNTKILNIVNKFNSNTVYK